MDYLDFEVEISPGMGREYPIAVITSPAGEARETMHFPFDELALQIRLKDLQIALLRSGGERRKALSDEEKTVQDFGRDLFNALLTGEVRNRYDVSMELANRDKKGLRLKLRIQPPHLAALPWEFLYDLRREEYMCLSLSTSVVRYLELPQPIQPLPIEPPLRILGMAISPSDLPRDLPSLDIEREKQRVEEAIKDLKADGLVELVWLQGQTWRVLQREMRTGPWHIFHFIGHGGFDRNSDEGFIYLADEEGKAIRFSATMLGRLLADHKSLRLVLLNSCEGARGSERDIFSSTASILVRRGIPAVLAMQYEITDRAAIEFARVFYETMADGMPVDASVTEARKAITFALTNTVEWGTPVLYMHSPNGVLFSIQKKKAKGRKQEKAAEETELQEQERREREMRLAKLSALYSKGMEALAAHDWQTAINNFNDTLALDAGYKDVSARLKEAEQQWELAKEKERQRLEEQEKEKARLEQLKSLYNKGKLAAKSQDWQTAIAAFQEVMALDSKYEDTAKMLASALAEQKRIEEARRQEAQLGELYAKAEKANKAKNWKLVISTCQEILTLDPSYKDVASLLEQASAEMRRTQAEKEKERRERWVQKAAREDVWEGSKEIVNVKTTLYVKTGQKHIEKRDKKRTVLSLGLGGKKKELVYDVVEKEVENQVEIRQNSIGMKFALIPAGEFMMGSEEFNDAKPVHKVRINKSFYLGIYPVTQREWKAVMEKNPSRFKGDDLPVENISWLDVQEYIKKLNKKEGTTKYRLPSEAEWEYAARAGTTTRYSFGDEESKLGEYAWYIENSDDKTHSVGQKKPNPWGLHDMHGNVWEWVQDNYHGNYMGAPSDGSAWEYRLIGSERVVRGGSWRFWLGPGDTRTGVLRSAHRAKCGSRRIDIGFRLLREL